MLNFIVCGNSIRTGGQAPDGSTQCNMACLGNSAEICGGSNRLNIYQYIGWNAYGCYTDSSSARSLANNVVVPGGQSLTTTESCQAACLSAGYSLAGSEYGQECCKLILINSPSVYTMMTDYDPLDCDNSIQNGGSLPAEGNTGCNMACSGNSAETCGGSNRLDLSSYKTISGTREWRLGGCWVDSGTARTLAYNQVVPGGSSTLTVQVCQGLCHDAGFILAGVEYGGECCMSSQFFVLPSTMAFSSLVTNAI